MKGQKQINVAIEVRTHKQLKTYVDEKGGKIGYTASRIIDAYLDRIEARRAHEVARKRGAKTK